MSCPPRDAFQIGWICALPIEAAAAAEMLDKDFGILEEQDAADSNTYKLGRIGKHHVVIACLPGGQCGTTSATTVANNMIRTFSKSLRIGLMVGVGGGIPSATHDIRLGDIVISYPQDTCGGVIQYDRGKVVVGGEFERTGSLNSPPRALLTAVSTMRAAALRDDPRYLEYLQSAIGRNAHTRQNFGRPAAQCDRLFQAKHDHPTNAGSCDGCPAGWEEIRSEREDSNPQPHYGIIASGNSVIKDGKRREQLSREQLRSKIGALCFEMEAAGLMLDFPCIVIRGVCDYADSHKNEQWQGYAALAAASYTKELLGYVPMGHVAQEALAVDVCGKIIEEIRGTNTRLDRAYDQQEQYHHKQKARALTGQQNKCHQLFKIANYVEQKNINPRRAEGTCEWALQSSEYIRWLESNSNDLLWVSADPGCGKSVLARSIIDDHEQASSATVTMCFFFFKDNGEQNHLTTALCSILHQLFSQRPHLLHYAIPSWEKNGERLQQEIDELWRVFTVAASADASHTTICIFDALDECRETDQGGLIEKLQYFYHQSFSSTQGTCLKFLVTSRPYDHIQNRFRAITDSFPCLHLKGEEENDQLRKEINLVVKMRVKELAETTALSLDMQQRLEQQLLQMDHRTYLWLHLAIDDIRSTFDSLRPAEESIRTIPPSVDAAYEKILSRVPLSQVNTVRKVFQIIMAARRPLKMAELAMALDIAIPPRTASEKLIPCTLQKKLRRWCGLFVFISNSSVYLIHKTAKEFLTAKENWHRETTEWRQSVNLRDANLAFSQICMTYLHETICQESYSQLLRKGQARNKSDGLLIYSATHWISHMSSGTNPTTGLLRLAGSLCDVERLSVWTRFVEPPFWYHRDINEPFPFFWAARWGLTDVADLLLQDSQIQITDEIMEKAAAHVSGEDTVIGLLLDRRGKEIRITDQVLQKAAANWRGGFAILKLLLDRRGDEIKVTDKVMQKAAANSSSGLSIMKLLLDRKGDEIKVTSRIMELAAANWGRGAEMIKYLFDEKGVEIRITRRVIQAALKNPSQGEDIMRVLRSRSYPIKRIMQRSRGQRRGRDTRKWDRYIKRYSRQLPRKRGN